LLFSDLSLLIEALKLKLDDVRTKTCELLTCLVSNIDFSVMQVSTFRELNASLGWVVHHCCLKKHCVFFSRVLTDHTLYFLMRVIDEVSVD